MNVYYYCSYTGSPVGYILGRIPDDAIKSSSEKFSLQNDEIPSLIRKCFEQGLVQRSFGRTPEGEYYLLVKKLTANGTGTNSSIKYYLNFAIVLGEGEKEKYRNLLRNENKATEQEIANFIRDTISLDPDNDFGFTVNCEKLNKLLNRSFYSLFEGCPSINKNGQKMYFKLVSEKPDNDQLKKSLGLIEEGKDFSHLSNSDKWFCYDKKKPGKQLILLLLLITIIVIACVIWFIASANASAPSTSPSAMMMSYLEIYDSDLGVLIDLIINI